MVGLAQNAANPRLGYSGHVGAEDGRRSPISVLGYGFWDLLMLGTHTLCKGGVMICWFGSLGRCVGASDHAIDCFLFPIVVFRVLYIIYINYCAVVRHTLMMILSLCMWL